MKDQDLLRNLKKELAQDFCGPFQGEQKEDCVMYYEKWIEREENKKQTDEQK